jgi:hypothetical protein
MSSSKAHQLELPHAGVVTGKARTTRANIGLPIRMLHGQWTAGGHTFGERMRCAFCGRRWEQHQADPQQCDELDIEKRRQVLAGMRDRDERRKDIGGKLRLAYKRKGYILKTLAAETAVPLTTLERVIQGKSAIMPRVAERIGPVLEFDPDWLIEATR